MFRFHVIQITQIGYIISYTLIILNNIKLAAHDAFFLLDRLRSNKLLELRRT